MKLQIIYLTLLATNTFAANILIMSLLASPSHYLWHKTYSMGLVERGHNVTIVSHDTDLQKIENYTNIVLEGVYDKLHSAFDPEEFVTYGPLQSIKLITDWELKTCKWDFETKGLQTLLNYPKNFKFDLIVWDLHNGKCLYPIIDVFGRPPVIGTSPFGNQPFIGYVFGNYPSSQIPFYQLDKSDEMNLYDRIFNYIYVHSSILWRRYVQNLEEEKMGKEFFGRFRSIDEYERHFSLMLVNTDALFNYPESMYPNSIPVAGLHIRPPKELPRDLKALLEGAKNGVIYMSFGTNLDLSRVDDKQKQAFFDAFQRLPYTILIKSGGTYENVSENIAIRKWLPQNDILAHPNIKLLITHGGALSTQEATYHGIPVLGIPFFLDQHSNMAKIQNRKLGKMIRFNDVSADLIYRSVMELLQDKKYKNNMILRSKKIKDQPETPLQRAVFWTEHVIRHGEEDHLSPSTRDANIFQRYDLDIFATLFGLVFLALYIIFKIFNIVLNLLFRNRTKLKIN